MNRARWILLMLGAAMVLLAPAGWALHRSGLDVEVWTDRGQDAVYQPGDRMEVRVRPSDDAYLLVYEIDAEGYVRLLFPDLGSRGLALGRETLEVPSERSNLDLVVEGPVGQGFIVAIASDSPFRALPWYLRPYDPHAEGVGYQGEPEEDDGVTREGRIVGDPFVAMERIRRRVVENPENADAFATAYTSYYVHHEVRYPRYLCYDCHRPHYWAWWDGFDPYYTHCSVFDFRVNWGWGWGPSYWFGAVPYYYYVYRADCPPRYRIFTTRTICYSSWDGWRRWSSLWGGNLRRYKSDPPAGYLPPTKFDDRIRGSRRLPPGFADRTVGRGRHAGLVPVTSRYQPGADGRWWKGDSPTAGESRDPVGRTRPEGGLGRPRGDGGDRERTAPGMGRERAGNDGRLGRTPPGLVEPSAERPRESRPEAPRWERPRDRGPEAPRSERPRERPEHAPKWEPPRDRGKDSPPPQKQEPRTEKPTRGRNGHPER